MVPITKSIVAIMDVAVTNGETVTGMIDTIEFDFVSINTVLSTSNDTTNNPSTLKITEGDTTVISNAAAIDALTGDDADGFTIPAAFTVDTLGIFNVQMDIDANKRKRYLFVSVTPLTTQGVAVIAKLSRGDEAPVNATRAGVGALVAV